MVTTNSPKVSGRHWYVNLPQLPCSSVLFTKWGIFRSANSSFSLSVIMSFLFICLLTKEIFTFSRFPTSGQKQICCRRLSSVLLPHPSLTTKRRRRDACSERFVWRRCRVWPHVPGRLIGCAPLPPGASEPAGWGSSRPSVPGSGSAPGDKQVSWCMKHRHAETMCCKWDVG